MNEHLLMARAGRVNAQHRLLGHVQTLARRLDHLRGELHTPDQMHAFERVLDAAQDIAAELYRP